MFIIKILWTLIQPLLTTKSAKYAVLAVILAAGTFYAGMHYEGLKEDSRQKEAIGVALDEFVVQAEKDGLFTKEIEIIKTAIVEKEIEVAQDAVKTKLCANDMPDAGFRRLFNESVKLTNTEKAAP